MSFQSVRPNQKRAAQQRGMTLIEVLVAIVILSFGMLSYAALQSVAIKQGKMAQYRTIAAQLATDYLDRMRANSGAAANGDYDYTEDYAPMAGALVVPVCALQTCTALEMRDIDQAQWRNTAWASLPGGSLYATLDLAAPVAPMIDFWVIWQDPDVGDENEIGQTCPDLLGVPVDGPACMAFRFAL